MCTFVGLCTLDFLYCMYFKCVVLQVLLQRLKEAEQFEEWESQEDQVWQCERLDFMCRFKSAILLVYNL